MKSIIQTFKKNRALTLASVFVVLFIVLSAVAIPYAVSKPLEDGLRSFSLIAGSLVKADDGGDSDGGGDDGGGDSGGGDNGDSDGGGDDGGADNDDGDSDGGGDDGDNGGGDAPGDDNDGSPGDTGGDNDSGTPPAETVPPPTAPTCTLSANPSTITLGGSSTLSWTTTDGVSMHIDVIGPVNLFGSVSVFPSTNTTYTGTVTGPGGTATCVTSIAVIAPVIIPAPTCTLSANPSTITVGGSSTLSWTTTNATSVHINTIGGVNLNTSTGVSPTTDTTYTATVTGEGGTVTCTTGVTVNAPPPQIINFTLTVLKLGNGTGTVTTTGFNCPPADTTCSGQYAEGTNLTLVAVASPGSTFTGWGRDCSATGTVTMSSDKTCTATFVLTPVLAPTCTLSISPSTITSGSSATLSWTSTNATSGSIDNSVGAMTPIASGSRTVSPTSNTTYTATITGPGGSAICTAPVTINGGGGGGGGGGGSSSPRCALFRASDTSIKAGERVTLRWETRRGSELRIEDNRNNELFDTRDDDQVDEGEVIVRPIRDTRYTLTVEKGSRDDTCTLHVDVANQEISLILDRDQQRLTSISLTQVPYTGFEAGPFLTSVFYTLLALWAASVAYVLVIKKGAVFGFVLRSKRSAETNPAYLTAVGSTAIPHAEYQSYTASPKPYAEAPIVSPFRTVESSVPANLPTGVYGATVTAEDEDAGRDGAEDASAHLEARAHQHNLVLSSDAIRLIMDQADSKEEEIALLDEIIARAKETYPREDGWIAINRERIAALFSDDRGASSMTGEMYEEKAGDSSLAEAIVTGNIAGAYAALGDMPLQALARAAADLDAIFRAHHGEHVTISQMLMRASSNLTNIQLEAAIAALTSAVDTISRDEETAVKLAVMNAIKATAG